MTRTIHSAFRRMLVLGLATSVTACGTLQVPVEQAETNLVAYAAELARLGSAERRAALDEAQARWEKTEDPRDRARVGLTRGQWGHDGYDPMTAAEDLEAALAAESADWEEAERAFLELRAAQLSYLSVREGEIKRARQELDEAQRKLRAITDIERTLGRDNDEE